MTLPRQLVENTSVFLTQSEKSATMASTIAQRIALALLVVAVLGAPVMGSLPTCCAKRASGEQSCCCRKHGPAATSTAGCCAKSRTGCCGQNKAETAIAIKAAAPSCCCKARSPLQAVPEEQARIELRSKQISMVAATAHSAISSQMAAHWPALSQRDVAPGPPRQVLLCRWLV